jgi:hypothetical protein
MAEKLMTSADGTKLLLDPDGLVPVLMESPCPYAQWGAIYTDDDGGKGTFSGSGSGTSATVVFTKNGSAGSYSVIRDLGMLYDGNGTLSLTLAKSGTISSWTVRVTTWWGPGTTTKVGDVAWTDVTTGTLTLPPLYWRYRLRISIQAITAAAGSSLTVSLSLS